MRHLVLAGNHQQYLRFLADGGHSPVDHQPIDIILARTVQANEVASLIQVGTYWENPVFGSDPYRELMIGGLLLGLPWATPWEADFLKAKIMRESRPPSPVSDQEIAAAAAAQETIERILG